MWEHIGVSNLRYTASAARSLMGDSIPMRQNAIYTLERQPIGVCGLIIPWNSPILMVTSKLGACLATGNTCVMKPASISSLVTLVFAEYFRCLWRSARRGQHCYGARQQCRRSDSETPGY